jgi:hypothetical protein
MKNLDKKEAQKKKSYKKPEVSSQSLEEVRVNALDSSTPCTETYMPVGGCATYT